MHYSLNTRIYTSNDFDRKRKHIYTGEEILELAKDKDKLL
jgi:hypothetical protein